MGLFGIILDVAMDNIGINRISYQNHRIIKVTSIKPFDV